MKSFDKSIQVNSNLTSSYFQKANLLKELGRLEEAVKFYDIVLDKDPRDFIVCLYFNFLIYIKKIYFYSLLKAYNNKGLALMDLNKLDEALKSFGLKLNFFFFIRIKFKYT